MKVRVVLHNIRSTYNVGAILRTAEGLGIDEVIFSGYTPSYHDERLLPHLQAKIDRQISKAALGAEKMVTTTRVDDLAMWLVAQKQHGEVVFGLENNLAADEEARRIILEKLETPEDQNDLSVKKWRGGAANDLILILGEEVAGIPAEIRVQCDYFLEIPMRGHKESFNVSVAAAIAMWELTKIVPKKY